MVVTRRTNTDLKNNISESDSSAEDPEKDLERSQPLPQAMDTTELPPGAMDTTPMDTMEKPQGATAQTPPSSPNSPTWCSKVSQNISELFKAIQTMKEELSTLREMAAHTTNSGNSNFTMPNEFDRLRQENAQLKAEIHELQRKFTNLDGQSRRENLLFDGITESDKETWSDSENKIRDILSKMEVPNHRDVKLERVHRKGEKNNDRPRTIIAKFSYYKDRENVWQKRFNLKSSNIWISEDFSAEVNKARQQLYPCLREGLRLKKDPNSGIKSVSLRVDKLYVNNRQYCANEIHKLPKCLQPESIATRTDNANNVVAFYTKHSVFSNLNTKFPFKLEGKQYNCPEQYFHRCKAIHFNDLETADKIMSTLDPIKQLQLGKTVKHYNHKSWMTKAREVLKHANIAKYSQNEGARKLLLETGNATLAESSPSKYWGTGLRLSDKNCTIPTWSGENQMGKILMEVRNSLL